MKNKLIQPVLLCSLSLFLPFNVLPAATTNVAFGSFFFNPPDVTIQVGDTVVWSNQIGSHTVTGTGADPICGPGFVLTSCSRTFNTPGEFPYICTVLGHAAAGMTGIVRVVQAPIAPAALSEPTLTAEGDFEFAIASTANTTNIVEATTNAASSGGWTPIAALTPTNSMFKFTDTNAGSFPIRFYRVVQPE